MPAATPSQCHNQDARRADLLERVPKIVGSPCVCLHSCCASAVLPLQDEEDAWAEERRHAEILYEAAKSRHQQRGQAKAARMASLAHKRIAPAPRGVDSDETSTGQTQSGRTVRPPRCFDL